MNKIIYFAVIFVLLFSGCSKIKKNITSSNMQKHNISKHGNKHDKKPLWVSNPNINGNIGVVSVVSKNKIKNKKKLYYIAKLKAQAAFQTRKGTNIDSQEQIKTKTDGSVSYAQNVKISSQHLQTNTLIVKQTYEDKDYFYMWMVSDK